MPTRHVRVAPHPAARWASIAATALAGSALACLSACASGTRSAPATQEPYAASAPAPEMKRPAKSKEGSQPTAPPAAGAAAEQARDYAAPPSPAPPSAAPAAPDMARKEAPGAADPHSATAGARMRLVEARRELDIATSERDCSRACRALESMERAAQQVCELARSPEERRECASAGEQVDKARTKVQAACGGCSQRLR